MQSGYTPSELRTAYDMAGLPTGAGQTVAVVEFDGYNPADIPVFLNQYGLPPLNLTNRLVDGATITPIQLPPPVGGGAIEVELDIEVVAGIAPGAAQIRSFSAIGSKSARKCTELLLTRMACAVGSMPTNRYIAWSASCAL
jgi:subtilase family serine protease